ncbi:MAG: hypothetical protein GXP63_06595 [DPANN group archaeon]|nr:hypothetical protein [DPANN group archaeon]
MLTLTSQTPFSSTLGQGYGYVLMGSQLFTLDDRRNGLARHVFTDGQVYWFQGGLNYDTLEKRIITNNLPSILAEVNDQLAEEAASGTKDRLRADTIRASFKHLTPQTYEQYILQHILGSYDVPLRASPGRCTSSAANEWRITGRDLLSRLPILTPPYQDTALYFHQDLVDLFSLRKTNDTSVVSWQTARQQVMQAVANLISSKQRLQPQYIALGSTKLFRKSTLSIDMFLQEYEQRYQGILDDLIRTSTAKVDKLKMVAAQDYQQSSDQLRALSRGRAHQQDKDPIWYERLTDKTFHLFLRIPPFVMVSSETYYYFKRPVTVRMKISFADSHGSVELPRIIHPLKYVHPFVYSPSADVKGQSICFNSGSSLTSLGVRLHDTPVHGMDDPSFARNVLLLLKKTVNGLTSGYVEGVKPVHNLSAFSDLAVPPSEIPSHVPVYYQDTMDWGGQR